MPPTYVSGVFSRVIPDFAVGIPSGDPESRSSLLFSPLRREGFRRRFFTISENLSAIASATADALPTAGTNAPALRGRGLLVCHPGLDLSLVSPRKPGSRLLSVSCPIFSPRFYRGFAYAAFRLGENMY